MPETPPIPPALSAEQWATARAWPHGLADYVAGVGEDMTYSDYAPEKLHAIVALANAALPDGDPRKVTRAMVEAIREAAHVLRARLSNPHFGMADDRSMVAYHARQCDAAAAALESMLPPAPAPR